jgi:GTP-binding protein
MFIDERLLTVHSGSGGDGIVAWRREARIPFGGPAGGDGGRGGDVILVADPGMTTFADMENVRQVRAEDGDRGGHGGRHGRGGADRVLHLPLGTTIYAQRSGRRLVDLVEPGQRWVVARGGRGGRGNTRFATATAQAPAYAEDGRPGKVRHLRLELRLLADVGLIGLPNAGKSTLLRRISRATPRVADYPFTTLAPCLGLVEVGEHIRFVVADLPGLIEGAHEGHGLGDRFLRHVERTRVLVHLVDLQPIDGSDPVEAYRVVRRELEAYGRDLAGRPEVLVASKTDLHAPGGEIPSEGPWREALSRLAAAADRGVIPISAATGAGVPVLLRHVARVLADAGPAPEVPDRHPDDPPT